MKTTIVINGIVKETEKAICVNCPVSWNSNKEISREFWMPKSVCTVEDDRIISVENWFIEKLRNQNVFHGYRISFNTFVVPA